MTGTEDAVIPLIIRQLVADGYRSIAEDLAEKSGITIPMTPSSRLSELIDLGKIQEQADSDDEYSRDVTTTNGEADSALPDPMLTRRDHVPEYRQFHFSKHNGPCGIAAFSPDGKLAATGAHDTAIKILSVDKMKNHSNGKPAVRTYKDHTGPVTDLCFHPNGKVLASCSADHVIKLYDLTNDMKNSFRYLQDAVPLNTLCFHPSGNYLLAGTQRNVLRLYDVNNFNCYTTDLKEGADGGHEGAITQVRYSSSGKTFATSSVDGKVCIWDSISGDCVKVLHKAHSGAVVSSVRFMKDEEHLLTAGLDSTLRLWNISSGRCVHEYRGHTQKNQWLQPTVSHDEQFVMIGDESSSNVFCWDKETTNLLTRIKAQTGNGTVLCVTASPRDDGILTCSDDSVARYFNTS